jgi:RNA polymerase sigma-70 factor (sigma-E family)
MAARAAPALYVVSDPVDDGASVSEPSDPESANGEGPRLAARAGGRGAGGRGGGGSSAASERDESITRLFDEHYRGLCRLAGLLLGDSAGAEEVVQEAFLRTFSGWWRVRYPERAQWYLRKSVVNLCRSRLRRRGTEERGNRVTWAEESTRIENAPERADDSMLIVAHVRRLPPRQRDAVVLRYYEDLPEAEIARILGCAVGTVKSQLAKARASLARAIGEDPSSSTGVGEDDAEPTETELVIRSNRSAEFGETEEGNSNA